MENHKLAKKAQSLKQDTDSVIYELISEVEELETENKKLNERVSELEDELNDLKS